jgi:hypothetical protein
MITSLSLISINIPGIARQVARVILDFSQLDILPSQLIYGYVFTFSPPEEDKPVNTFFE